MAAAALTSPCPLAVATAQLALADALRHLAPDYYHQYAAQDAPELEPFDDGTDAGEFFAAAEVAIKAAPWSDRFAYPALLLELQLQNST